MWAWLLLLILNGALAQEPLPEVRFFASPGAEVVVFPSANPKTIEIGVFRNRVPITDQLSRVSARWLLDADAVSIGGGTTYVNLHVERDDLTVQAVVEGGLTRLILTPGTSGKTKVNRAPSVDELIEHLDYRRPQKPSPIALAPMRGDAAAGMLDLRQVNLELPMWLPDEIPGELGTFLGMPPNSLRSLDGYRFALTETDNDQIRAMANYQLAVGHLMLDMPREATYYAKQMLESSDSAPASAGNLIAAAGLLKAGRAEDARQRCVEARKHGASDYGTLQCLGITSLGDGYPSPSHTARALVATGDNPQFMLLAGQLLQLDNRHEEALPILEALAHDPPSGLSDNLWMSLGDSQYMTGKIEDAKKSWSNIEKSSRLHPVAHIRGRMAELVVESRSEWAQAIPEFHTLTELGGPAEAEARYILAQIAQAEGDMESAADNLLEIWRNHRSIALDSDVPERLMMVCKERVNSLHRTGRWADEAATFDMCWRKDLDTLSSDTAVLEQVSQVLSNMGLFDEALAIQQRALAVHTLVERDEPSALLRLAELYNKTHHPEEALKTLLYVDRNTQLVDKSRRYRLEADAHRDLGAIKEAESSYKRAATGGEEAPLARRALGIMLADDDRCKQAIPLLKQDEDRDAQLTLARCQIRESDPESALQTSLAILDSVEDPWTQEQATWLAAVASVRGPQPPAPLPENASSLGLWNTLIDEELAISQLKKRLTTPPGEPEETEEVPEENEGSAEEDAENSENSGDQG